MQLKLSPFTPTTDSVPPSSTGCCCPSTILPWAPCTARDSLPLANTSWLVAVSHFRPTSRRRSPCQDSDWRRSKLRSRPCNKLIKRLVIALSLSVNQKTMKFIHLQQQVIVWPLGQLPVGTVCSRRSVHYHWLSHGIVHRVFRMSVSARVDQEEGVELIKVQLQMINDSSEAKCKAIKLSVSSKSNQPNNNKQIIGKCKWWPRPFPNKPLDINSLIR